MCTTINALTKPIEIIWIYRPINKRIYKWKKNFAIEICETLKSKLESSEVQNNFKTSKQHFTRMRKLTFATIAVAILTGRKMSIGNRLRKFFKLTANVKNLVSVNAFSKARKKIKSELYKSLNQDSVEMYYDKGGKHVKRWQGKLLWVVDGSAINLPDSEETRAFYSESKNSTPVVRIQGLASVLFDALNEVVINAELCEKISESDIACAHHISHCTKDSVVIYDRGYANYKMIATHTFHGSDFVIRVPAKSSFSAVSNFMNSSKNDTIVEISIPNRQFKCMKQPELPNKITVRLLKIPLSTGECEVLITSLLDKSQYPYNEFQWLYHQRWCIETYFDRLKNLLDIERFSSKFDLEIQQDFHALIFLSSLESIVIKEDEDILYSKDTQHKYKVNKAISYAEVADSIVDLLLNSPKTIEEVFEDMRHILQASPVAIRPDRSYPRKKHITKQLYFQLYGKKPIP